MATQVADKRLHKDEVGGCNNVPVWSISIALCKHMHRIAVF